MKSKRHLLINLLFAFLISLLVYGCSARKTQTSIHKQEREKTEQVKTDIKTDEKQDVKTSTDQTTKEQETSEQNKNNVLTDQEISVTIEPAEGDEWSVYDFVVGNTVFKGTSKGKITFSNKLKIDSINESLKIVKDVTKNIKKDSAGTTTKKAEVKIDSKVKEKEKTKDKEKTADKKEPLALNIGMSIAVIISVLLIAFGVYLILKRYRVIK